MPIVPLWKKKFILKKKKCAGVGLELPTTKSPEKWQFNTVPLPTPCNARLILGINELPTGSKIVAFIVWLGSLVPPSRNLRGY